MSINNIMEPCIEHIYNVANNILCDTFSHAVAADYKAALNASIYYANISSDTPLNTPVFRIRLSINANQNPVDISIRFFRTAQIQSLFEFEGSSDNPITISPGDLQTVGSAQVFDTSINLVADPVTVFTDESAYPLDVDLTISLVVFFLGSGTAENNSIGLVHILRAPGKNYSNYNYFLWFSVIEVVYSKLCEQ